MSMRGVPYGVSSTGRRKAVDKITKEPVVTLFTNPIQKVNRLLHKAMAKAQVPNVPVSY
jgi:hypothetical protein